jgi:hypothetical protein
MNYQPIAALAIAELHRTIYPAPFANVVAGRGKRRPRCCTGTRWKMS